MGYFCLPPGAAHVRRRAFGGMRSTAPLGAPLFHSSFGGARAWAQSDSPSPPWSEWRPSRGGLAARARARFGSALPKAQDRLGSSRDRPRAAIALEPRSPSSRDRPRASIALEPACSRCGAIYGARPPASSDPRSTKTTSSFILHPPSFDASPWPIECEAPRSCPRLLDSV